MRLYQLCILLFLFTFPLTACQKNDDATAVRPVVLSQIDLQSEPELASLDGLWRTEGYGQLYEIEGDRFQMYAVTAVSCVPTLSGEVLPASTRPSTRGENEAWLDIHILQENGVSTIGVQVIPTGSPDEKRFIVDGITSALSLRRLRGWPNVCQNFTPNTPITTFDAFWQTYAEHYPFFAMKNIDWQAVRAQYRPQINEQTTDEALFAILQEMITPLQDAHTWIEPIDLETNFEGQRPDPNPLTAADWQRTEEIIASSFLAK